MGLKPELFRLFDHLGSTRPIRDLVAAAPGTDLVALRHDIDHSLDLALEVAHHEHARGLRATYFLLHTHAYWNDPDFELKVQQLLAYGHEVSLHVNALTAWMQGAADEPSTIVATALRRLREIGATVSGVAAHGDRACYDQRFTNWWLWRELRGEDPASRHSRRSAEGVEVNDSKWQIPCPHDDALRRADGRSFPLWSSSLAEFELEYEAVFLAVEKYWTDSGGSWTRSGDPLNHDLRTGRHQVLVHPWWWRAPGRLIFVLSSARSGSKWLANFVEKATSASGVHEWTLNHRRRERQWVAEHRTGDDFVGLLSEPAEVRTLISDAAIHHRALGGDVVEANVYLEAFLPELRSLVPDAIFIHLHRDGRQVVRSILERGWYDTPEDRRHRPVDDVRWVGASQFERACLYWASVQERISAFASARVSLERATTDRAGLECFLSEVGIVTHPLLADRVFATPLNASRATVQIGPESWTADQRTRFAVLAGDAMRGLGYPDPGRGPPLRIEAAPVPRREIRTITDLGGTMLRSIPHRAHHCTVTATDEGLEISIPASKRVDDAAWVMLTQGTWNKVDVRQGITVPLGTYLRGELDFSAGDIALLRCFVVLFDESGRQRTKVVAAVLRPGAARAVFAVSPVPGVSHAALAIHAARLSAPSNITIRRVLMQIVPLSAGYQQAVPGAVTP